MTPAEQEVLELTRRLLVSILEADWETYALLSDPGLTAFEPESLGHLVEGLAFHQFYFDRGAAPGPHNVTLASPHVRIFGDVAVVCYVRLIQRLDGSGSPVTQASAETRIWHRRAEGWKHVHFHRSPVG